MAHGGGHIFGSAHLGQESSKPSALNAIPPTKHSGPTNFQGFTHFLGEPREAQRSKFGTNNDARQIFEALYQLLEPTGVENKLNEEMPAGYTYLLQLMAHDLVESTVPSWAAADAGIESRNMRSGRLVLDTLYGGDRKSTRLNSSHLKLSRMPSSA